MCFFMVALTFKNLCHCENKQTPKHTVCAVAAAPFYTTEGIYQLLYKRYSVPDPNWSYFTRVSLTGDRKK